MKKEISLECSGDYLFNFGFIVGYAPGEGNEKVYSYTFDDASGIGNGEYKFVFDSEKITKMIWTETMNATYSRQITDSQMKEEDANMEYCTMLRNSNGNIVIECELNHESKYVQALNTDGNTPSNLKTILEDKTNLVCE